MIEVLWPQFTLARVGTYAVDSDPMRIERFNPDGLSGQSFYHHVVRSESRFLVHISGQVGIDSEGDLVGGDDFAVHVDQAYANLDTALVAAGVSRADVVKVTTFVVRYDREDKWPIIKSAHLAFFGDATPAWTVVGVVALARPDLLIEIEGTAARD
jgi:enamine deaminase RidA (YjgF/YER057c/UK114 family)